MASCFVSPHRRVGRSGRRGYFLRQMIFLCVRGGGNFPMVVFLSTVAASAASGPSHHSLMKVQEFFFVLALLLSTVWTWWRGQTVSASFLRLLLGTKSAVLVFTTNSSTAISRVVDASSRRRLSAALLFSANNRPAPKPHLQQAVVYGSTKGHWQHICPFLFSPDSCPNRRTKVANWRDPPIGPLKIGRCVVVTSFSLFLRPTVVNKRQLFNTLRPNVVSLGLAEPK